MSELDDLATAAKSVQVRRAGSLGPQPMVVVMPAAQGIYAPAHRPRSPFIVGFLVTLGVIAAFWAVGMFIWFCAYAASRPPHVERTPVPDPPDPIAMKSVFVQASMNDSGELHYEAHNNANRFVKNAVVAVYAPGSDVPMARFSLADLSPREVRKGSVRVAALKLLEGMPSVGVESASFD